MAAECIILANLEATSLHFCRVRSKGIAVQLFKFCNIAEIYEIGAGSAIQQHLPVHGPLGFLPFSCSFYLG